jgi:hypothetical protein
MSHHIANLPPLYRKNIKWAHIPGNSTVVLRETGQSAILHHVQINTPADQTWTIFNNGAASGEVVADFTSSAFVIETHDFHIRLNNGLTIRTDGAALDLTVVYE